MAFANCPFSISTGDNGCVAPIFSANGEGRPLGLCLLTFEVPNCDHPIQFGGLLNELPLPQPSRSIPFWLSSPIHYYWLFISCELKAWTMVASHGCCLQCFLWLGNMVFLMGRLEIIASLVVEWHWQYSWKEWEGKWVWVFLQLLRVEVSSSQLKRELQRSCACNCKYIMCSLFCLFVVTWRHWKSLIF